MTAKPKARDFGVDDNAIDGYAKEFDGLDANDKDGYKATTKAIATVRTARTGVEAARKALKEPHLVASRDIDAEAKRLTARLEVIETPLKAAKQAVDDERARVEAERIGALRSRIDEIRELADIPRDAKPDDIAARIQGLEQITVTAPEFQELYVEATTELDAAKRIADMALAEAIVRRDELAAAEARAKAEAEAAAKAAEAHRLEMEQMRRQQAEADAKAKAEREQRESVERAEAEKRAAEAAAQAAELARIQQELAEAKAAAAAKAEAEKEPEPEPIPEPVAEPVVTEADHPSACIHQAANAAQMLSVINWPDDLPVYLAGVKVAADQFVVAVREAQDEQEQAA